jgi:hypothetical protein
MKSIKIKNIKKISIIKFEKNLITDVKNNNRINFRKY